MQPESGLGSSALHGVIEPVSTALEIAGVGVILLGIVLATAGFLRNLRGVGWEEAYGRYRANLGRGILLGLEILVGADIIDTVTAPLTWTSVGLLGAIVLIRTFLSFSLETEIEGRWPWARSRSRSGAPAP
jgi:uncharacterized membrane protein